MLEYNRIDLSEGINSNKCKYISKKCSLGKFCYFLDKNVNYGPYLCDGYYDMSLKAINMKNLAIVYRGERAYCINFESTSKNDAFNLIKNSVIIDKRGAL